jgi:SAM-dependent methyltransferase
MPSPNLNFTGERLVTSVRNQSMIEHLHRYALAKSFCSGQRVLDIASGEGYGSALLAKEAAFVVGVDIDPLTIRHAREKYGCESLHYALGSCDAIPLPVGDVDLVVSFETIEHHDRHDQMMQEVKRVLRPGGTLILSCPDRVNYSEKRGYTNPYHVKELNQEELLTLVGRYFVNVELYAQRFAYGSFVIPNGSAGATFGVWSGDFSRIEKSHISPMYFVVLASDSTLPNLGCSFFDGDVILRTQLDSILCSSSYRLGHAMLQPLRALKRLFQGFK